MLRFDFSLELLVHFAEEYDRHARELEKIRTEIGYLNQKVEWLAERGRITNETMATLRKAVDELGTYSAAMVQTSSDVKAFWEEHEAYEKAVRASIEALNATL